MNRCSICHGDLPNPKGICPGLLPGPIGLMAFSPGKCLSTPIDRERRTRERIEKAKAAEEKSTA